MNEEKQEEETKEVPVGQDLIVRSAGMLRVPRGFRKTYPKCIAKETPTPAATQRINHDGSISLIYTWKPGTI